MFSAYDIKKIIPRAVFALIAINLSWSLMDIFIRMIDVLGSSVYGLILAPFNGILGIDLSGTGNTFSAILGGAITLAVGAAVLGLIPVLGVAIAGATGILLAFGIVMVRRVALIGLILIAPVAIASGILPQTESWFKKWWEWFSKLLLMYPFIMAFFALSRVAAGIISQGGQTGVGGMIYQVGAVAVLVLPYFLIGKAFSLAGGAIGKLAGVVNNKDKGLIDGVKKWEQGKVGEQRNRFGAGTMKERTALGRTANFVGRTARNPRSVFSMNEDRRAATVLSAADRDAGSLEQRHEAAKTLSKEEVALLAAGTDEKTAVSAYAAQLIAASGGTLSREEALSQAQVLADATKRKVGGKLTAGTQLYALRKGATEGTLTADQASAGVKNLSQALGSTPDQRTTVARTLAAQLDGASPSPFGEIGASLTPGGVPATSPLEVEKIFREGSLSTDKLGSLKTPQAQIIFNTKRQQVNDSLSNLNTAFNNNDLVAMDRERRNLIQHQADLIVMKDAALAQNNMDVATGIDVQLADLSTQLANNQHIGGQANADLIATEAREQATSRVKKL